ncbi:short-chain dehydrogenase reductase 3b [Quercus suber]|uniref:Short-chain dehydrogenase reductase 3b n=1 Tax=Quercus suber TaxID=58331 RepID=A0AAW0IZM8_QUESU
MAESVLCKKKLEGKVVIVTGGASGIGETTAHLFASHGARMVVIADVQDELAQSVVESIGLNLASYIHCDVTDEKQVEAMVEWTLQNYGKLDIMFSNAGIFNSTGTAPKSKLQGKVAIITGGASGMGEATARHFATHGARAIVIADVQDEKGQTSPHQSAPTYAPMSTAMSATRNR